MQLKSYRDAKTAGNVQLQKYGESFKLVKRQYDPDTGTETMPQEHVFTLKELQNERDNMALALAEMDAMLADATALKNG